MIRALAADRRDTVDFSIALCCRFFFLLLVICFNIVGVTSLDYLADLLNLLKPALQSHMPLLEQVLDDIKIVHAQYIRQIATLEE